MVLNEAVSWLLIVQCKKKEIKIKFIIKRAAELKDLINPQPGHKNDKAWEHLGWSWACLICILVRIEEAWCNSSRQWKNEPKSISQMFETDISIMHTPRVPGIQSPSYRNPCSMSSQITIFAHYSIYSFRYFCYVLSGSRYGLDHHSRTHGQ